MRLATCSEPWREQPVEAVFGIAAQLGFDGVELAPFTIADDVADIPAARRRQIVRAAGDAGVVVVGLHWLFISPKGLHLTTPDAAVRRRSAEYIQHLADFCADVGGKVMTFGSPKQRDIVPPTTFAEGWQRAREVYASCAEVLAGRGVTLCIEALTPADTNFINTVEDAARLADEIGHPNIDIMLDCRAMSAMPDGVVGTIRRFGGRAKHFHANEASGKGVGMLSRSDEPPLIDYTSAMRALAESGYDGWVSVEPFDDQPDPTTVAQTAIRTLRKAMAK